MKVTHIIDSGGYYGAEVMLVQLCQAQQKAGLQVEVISIGTRGNYKKPLEEKFEEYGIPYLPWRMLALPDLRESFKILRHCRTSGTDVIHSHGYKGNILLGLIPKQWRKMPVITTVHGYTRHKDFSKMAVNQWLDKFCLSKLDAVVLVSKGMVHQIPAGRIGNNLKIINNGIQKETPAEPSMSTPEFSKDHFNIITIGRLSPEKNFQFLISTMPAILEVISNAKLHIYGEGNERVSLESQISSLNMGSFIYLPGYISNTSQIYENADLFINCSTTEGMPITLLEAMRADCAILASKIEANKSLLDKDSMKDLLFDLTSEDLIKKIRKIKPFKRGELKDHFLKNFTSEKMQEKYQSLYAELLSNYTPGNS